MVYLKMVVINYDMVMKLYVCILDLGWFCDYFLFLRIFFVLKKIMICVDVFRMYVLCGFFGNVDMFMGL